MTELILLLVALAVPENTDETLSQASKICLAAIYETPVMMDSKTVPGALNVCTLIASLAIENNVDPVLAVAVAHHESRFKDLPSYTGRRMLACGKVKVITALPNWVEQGALQVKPKWHCAGGRVIGCDANLAGIKLLHSLVKKHKTARVALGYYKRPRFYDGRYAGAVLKSMTQLQGKLDDKS